MRMLEIVQVSRSLVPVVRFSSGRPTIHMTMIPQLVATTHGAQKTTSNTNILTNSPRTKVSVSRVESTELDLGDGEVAAVRTVLRKRTIIWDTPKINSRLIREGWGYGTMNGRIGRRCGDRKPRFCGIARYLTTFFGTLGRDNIACGARNRISGYFGVLCVAYCSFACAVAHE